MFPVFVKSDRGFLSDSNSMADSWLPLDPRWVRLWDGEWPWASQWVWEWMWEWAWEWHWYQESENVWTRHWELDKLTMCQALIGAA